MLDRFRLIPRACGITFLTLAAAGCQSAGGADPATRAPGTVVPRTAVINHLAFFKLKDAGDAAELIADCDAGLGTLPMVTAYFCGRHLDTGRGDRVDANYDVGFFVGFATVADYAAYVEHPSHKTLVAKWQARWAWIRVQDILDEAP